MKKNVTIIITTFDTFDFFFILLICMIKKGKKANFVEKNDQLASIRGVS